MTRIKRGYIAQKRRTKIRLFTLSFRGAHSRLTRTISQRKIKALVSANRDRDRKKRGFCMYNMYKGQFLRNRKIVAQMGILKGNCLLMIANEIIT
ncbi:hypothetical protein Ahy_A07g034652 isoform A [Arachis hypogaea]|uniref:Large ribosomal subunit protein bL20c n=1 Tax=Arachis hypogaea TaxID=3818 RepID=A0A445CCG5_ARAHY|nr:hypothetical protein Ahy_A07g034652 isoform A [Arachis hypogaea]